MIRGGRLAVVCVVTAAIGGGVIVAGGVAAASTRRRIALALQATKQRPDAGTEKRIDGLIRQMTLDEKLNQLTLLSDGQINDAEARKPVGAVFSLTDPAKIDHYQQIAVEQSRLHIPILFAFDTIHGFRTVFPIPLATASSFDPAVAGGRPHDRRGRVRDGRSEADLLADGRRLARPALGADQRGRGRGPVPELGDGRRARQGRAGRRLRARPTGSSRASSTTPPTAQPEAGRDYATTDMSLSRLWNTYLPPFKAAIDAGVGHRDVLVQRDQRRAGLRERLPREPRPQGPVGLRRVHRERLHRGRRAARLPAA